jgi:hypothetical protein
MNQLLLYVLLQLSELGNIKLCGLYNILANLAVVIFRIIDFGRGYDSSYIALTLGWELELKP